MAILTFSSRFAKLLTEDIFLFCQSSKHFCQKALAFNANCFLSIICQTLFCWKYNMKICFQKRHCITKTCLYNFGPLKPHFYITKLGLTGVNVYIIFFLLLLKTIDCGYSLKPPRQGGSNEYKQSLFWAEIWKISDFFIWKSSVFGGKIFRFFFTRHVFLMFCSLSPVRFRHNKKNKC